MQKMTAAENALKVSLSSPTSLTVDTRDTVPRPFCIGGTSAEGFYIRLEAQKWSHIDYDFGLEQIIRWTKIINEPAL